MVFWYPSAWMTWKNGTLSIFLWMREISNFPFLFLRPLTLEVFISRDWVCLTGVQFGDKSFFQTSLKETATAAATDQNKIQSKRDHDIS